MKISNTLLKNKDKILLLKKPTHGLYTIPGGKVELDETEHDAAVREYYEETGLNVKNLNLRSISSVKLHEKNFEMFTFFTENFDGKLVEFCLEGELEWISIDSINNTPMYDGDRRIVEHILNNSFILVTEVEYNKDNELLYYNEVGE